LFQAAWDQFNAKVGGPSLRVEPPNRLMEKLDAFRWDAATVMPEGSWKAWCGPATAEFLKQVNREAAAITKEPHGPFQSQQESSQSLACFGILAHEVEFHRTPPRGASLAPNKSPALTCMKKVPVLESRRVSRLRVLQPTCR